MKILINKGSDVNFMLYQEFNKFYKNTRIDKIMKNYILHMGCIIIIIYIPFIVLMNNIIFI